MQVEIWSDVVCPWCYLGKRRFEQALDAFARKDQVEVTYRSFELDPTVPKGVTSPTVAMLASKYGMTAQQAEQAQRQMEQRAAADGLVFRMADLRSGNTRDAHRLLQLAKARGRQDELMERLHSAYFTEQASIFDHEELTRLAVQTGLDSGEVTALLAGDDYGAEVEADEAMARTLGVTGVPFFVIDRRYGVSGAQPADTITQVLEKTWSEH
ncbi:MAG TPA: DsbA family oxidoreductase [Streptosporangiaceae bacterium]|nr:DsbA family oxidoreductase [Streptosporangiaceae bacterium]